MLADPIPGYSGNLLIYRGLHFIFCVLHVLKTKNTLYFPSAFSGVLTNERVGYQCLGGVLQAEALTATD